ncbi:hypothetical protein FOZ61_001203, partial [Perkinsus olseni]
AQICTFRDSGSRRENREKRRWIRKHLTGRHSLISAYFKSDIPGEALIDDDPIVPLPLGKPVFGRHVIFTKPYNKGFRTADRIDNWFESRIEAEMFVHKLSREKEGLPVVYETYEEH